MKKNNKTVRTVFGELTKVEGGISSEDNIRIDGEVVGNVDITGFLIVSSGAKITGNVVAEKVMVSGYIKGKIIAKTSFEAIGEAVIHGDVEARSLSIADDVVFKGNCVINAEKENKNGADAEESVVSEANTEE